MKALIDWAAVGFFVASALLWLMSAKVRLTPIGMGLEELDHVTRLSADLQRMGRWNFFAALTTAVAVSLEAVKRFI
jgi:hypothetical protein